MEYQAVATCAFGLESVLSFELKRLGVRGVAASDGRVAFTATGADIARANIRLRTAERVLLVLGRYPAATFDELYDGARDIAWGDVVDRTDAFPVKGYSMNSTLTSVPACQAVLKKAVVERLKQDHHTDFLTEKGGVTKRIRFSLVKNLCTIMLDTSGDGLHKRGYRPLQHEAPIRETLAAGICDFARIFPDSRAADPFCGSGTLLIEAALRARNIAPGLNRAFAGEEYGFLGDGVFSAEKEKARAEINADVPFSARGIDNDPDAIAIAAQNAARAGVADCIAFETGDARRFRPAPDETILANPPYGERLMKGQEREIEALYRDFGRAVADMPYKGLYVISSHPDFERLLGKKAVRRRKLYNGMLPCQLFMYY